MHERKTRYAVCNISGYLNAEKNVLAEEVKAEMQKLFTVTATRNDMEILAAEVMPDHIHLFMSTPPRLSPSDVVNMFKGVSARWLRARFPELKKPGDALWTRTCCIGTAGSVTEETIRRYIEEQTVKSISDASRGMFFTLLAYKAEEAGHELVKVTPHGTSQMCSGCGGKVAKSLSVRIHRCHHCGLTMDRDENAALNIKALGQRVQALTREISRVA